MNKQLITSKAVRQVFRDYWQQYKTHPWRTAGAFFLPATGTIFVFFVPPLIVAKLIDIFAAHHEISFDTVGKYIILFASLWFLGEVLWLQI